MTGTANSPHVDRLTPGAVISATDTDADNDHDDDNFERDMSDDEMTDDWVDYGELLAKPAYNKAEEAAILRKHEWHEEDIAWALGDEIAKSGSGNRDTAERSKMADEGKAMPGGRYPVGNSDELKKAIRAVGRGKGSHDAIRRHIISAARKLGLSNMIPSNWGTAAASVSKTFDVELWKSAEESQHIVYGVVLEPNLRDSQGDVISAAEIEKAAHKFLQDSRQHDVQHDEQPAPIHLVESYCAPHDMVLGGRLVHKGAWVIGCKVEDEALWKRVTDPSHEEPLTGFSIGGSGFRLPDAA
jgi:hypothetical protein